jgi:hypothetical protein
VEKELFIATTTALRSVAGTLDGSVTEHGADADLDRLERALEQSVTALRHMDIGAPDYSDAVDVSFHARTLGFGARTAALQAMAVTGRTDVAESSYAARELLNARPGVGILSAIGGVTLGHASLRSVWFLNSMRGAVGLAAATAVADLSGCSTPSGWCSARCRCFGPARHPRVRRLCARSREPSPDSSSARC